MAADAGFAVGAFAVAVLVLEICILVFELWAWRSRVFRVVHGILAINALLLLALSGAGLFLADAALQERVDGVQFARLYIVSVSWTVVTFASTTIGRITDGAGLQNMLSILAAAVGTILAATLAVTRSNWQLRLMVAATIISAGAAGLLCLNQACTAKTFRDRCRKRGLMRLVCEPRWLDRAPSFLRIPASQEPQLKSGFLGWLAGVCCSCAQRPAQVEVNGQDPDKKQADLAGRDVGDDAAPSGIGARWVKCWSSLLRRKKLVPNTESYPLEKDESFAADGSTEMRPKDASIDVPLDGSVIATMPVTWKPTIRNGDVQLAFMLNIALERDEQNILAKTPVHVLAQANALAFLVIETALMVKYGTRNFSTDYGTCLLAATVCSYVLSFLLLLLWLQRTVTLWLEYRKRVGIRELWQPQEMYRAYHVAKKGTIMWLHYMLLQMKGTIFAHKLFPAYLRYFLSGLIEAVISVLTLYAMMVATLGGLASLVSRSRTETRVEIALANEVWGSEAAASTANLARAGKAEVKSIDDYVTWTSLDFAKSKRGVILDHGNQLAGPADNWRWGANEWGNSKDLDVFLLWMRCIYGDLVENEDKIEREKTAQALWTLLTIVVIVEHTATVRGHMQRLRRLKTVLLDSLDETVGKMKQSGASRQRTHQRRAFRRKCWPA